MKKRGLFYFLLLTQIYLSQAGESFAQEIRIIQPPNTGLRPEGRTGSALAQSIFDSIVTIIYSVGFVAFIVMIVWGGLDWILSGGDKDKIKSAQKRITTAIIGIAVLAFSFFIARVVGDLLGIKVLESVQLPSLLPGSGGARSSGGGNVQ